MPNFDSNSPATPSRRVTSRPPAPTPRMHNRLAQVTNWPELARTADYRTNNLARMCGVSTRELERFFLFKTGKCPHRWLNDLRQIEAIALIAAGKSVKETAIELHYKHPAHFSRDFKHFHGLPPTSAQSATPPPARVRLR
jgi:transcriptional regulator GlxA family with amidase domain